MMTITENGFSARNQSAASLGDSPTLIILQRASLEGACVLVSLCLLRPQRGEEGNHAFGVMRGHPNKFDCMQRLESDTAMSEEWGRSIKVELVYKNVVVLMYTMKHPQLQPHKTTKSSTGSRNNLATWNKDLNLAFGNFPLCISCVTLAIEPGLEAPSFCSLLSWLCQDLQVMKR